MSHLSLFLRGSPRLEGDGVPVEFARRKNVALLAYLAMTGTSHTRDFLITLLWPELEPSRARASLRRNLSVLRRALGEEQLLTGGDSIALESTADFSVDVDQFHRLLRAWQAHGHPEAEVCAKCLEALSEAVELYRGDFLAGFTLQDSVAFDDWQFFQTEGLRQELGSALERLARGYSAQGQHETPIPHARRWVALDPLHEPAHRELMRIYAQAGQRAAALRQYRECERVLEEELGAVPSEETTALYEEIRARLEQREASSVATPAPRPRHNLPAQPTPFIGREAVLGEIKERLEDPACRLLTLVGPGGSGKTRLALEAGADQLADFEDGVFLVSLAALRSVESIEPTVAAALGFSLSGVGDPRQQVLRYLSEKSLLLILDNFEHLLLSSLPPAGGDKGGEALVTDILKAASHVKILATSRVGLKVRGEHLFPVSGMGAPSVPSRPAVTLADVDQYDAVRLFTAAARRRQPAFELTDDNLTDAVRICHLVGGMPLGILMAAAWVGILTPSEIGDEILQGLDFLEADRSDVPKRQRSMRAVFDHSWNLLTERQQEVFQALSVFRGGFTRQAAQRVTGASLRELKVLVDRSLVQRTLTAWYEMHELLRQYAADQLRWADQLRREEKLDGSPPARETAHDRHCAYYISALENWGQDLKGHGQLAALAEMDVEIENARAAWDWAVQRAQAQRLDRAIEGLCHFYDWRGRWQEGEATCQAAAMQLEGMPYVDGSLLSPDETSAAEGLRVLARCLMWQGFFCWRVPRREAANRLARRSLTLLQSPVLADQDTRAERAFALGLLGFATPPSWEQSTELLEQSTALYQALGDRWGEADALGGLAYATGRLGAYVQAKPLAEAALARCQALGDQRTIASSLWILAWTTMHQRQLEATNREDVADRRVSTPMHSLGAGSGEGLAQYEQARTLGERSLAICREAGFPRDTEISLFLLSCVALGKAERRLGAGPAPHLEDTGKAREAYAEAQRLAQECAVISREIDCRHDLCWAHAIHVVAARGLGYSHQAWQHLGEALQIHAELGGSAGLIQSVAATALLLADAGEHEQAVEIYALASRYPYVANSRWFEDVFGRHIDAVAATLPPDVVEAARDRGRARDLEATVKELLAELEGWEGGIMP